MAAPLSFRLSVLTALHVLVALVFLKGFLLTRVELPDISSCTEASCNSRAAYSKAVVLIVDALRYDFVCSDGSSAASFRGRFPKTLGLVGKAGDAAVVARFVADTPTITMSRLKALLTGGLPTFLDVGQSFSASALSEDNLLQQLQAQGKNMVVMGDDTWMQLAKDVFAEAHPYPSFDVHDLHTVDDGVWEHLLPLLARPDSWDVLIAHYLGVDHAGHTHGVVSRQMEAKLDQMDSQVSHVIESLAAQAGPGGPYADTLLLVLSDHGQTLGGDHGGGTPDETDSVLLAASLRKMNAALQRQTAQQANAAPNTADVLGTSSPLSDSQQQQQQCSTQCQAGSEQSLSSARVLQRLMRTGGFLLDDDAPADDTSSISTSAADAADAGRCPQQCWPWLCSSSMSQIDLTPTIAHLLGVPIPFGNLGKLPPHLFAALAVNSSSTGAAGSQAGLRPEAWLPQYAAALHANAQQVHGYLSRYAVVGGLPAADLSSANKLYQHAQQLWAARQDTTAAASKPPRQADNATAGHESSTADEIEQLVVAQLAFLNAAVELARRRFTLFQQGPIWAACAMGVAVLALQLVYCWRAVRSSSPRKACSTDRIIILLFVGLAAFHALGLFSVGLLMGEGRLQCVLLGAATLLMLCAVLSAIMRARRTAAAGAINASGPLKAAGSASTGMPARNGYGGVVSTDQDMEELRRRANVTSAELRDAGYWCSWQPVVTAVAAAAVMLACNVLLQAMGLIDRAGQDPHDKTQPSGDLLMGPDAAWQQSLLLCFTVGPLVCVWMLLSWWSAWMGQHFSDTAAGSRDQQWSGKALDVLIWVLRRLCSAQFLALGVFWAAQLSGLNGLTAADASGLARAQLQQVVTKTEALCRAHALVLTCLSSFVDMNSLQGVLEAAVSGSGLGSVMQLPLRVLLPRVVYASAVAAFCGTAIAVCISASCNMLGKRAVAKSVMQSGSKLQRPPATGFQLCVWLCAVFAAALVMVLGYKGPATMLAALVQAGCCCQLQRLHAAATRAADYNLGCAKPQQQQQHGSASIQSVVGGGMWGMMGLQLFFCSSHFCEFSGLQYASAFIGFDSMVWYTSGSLLLLNTCGFLLLAVLSLPGFALACTMADSHQPQLQSAEHVQQQLSCSLLVVNSMRFAALVVCMVSAAVQQQHILLWAIFAPKLCFELWFMAVTDVGQLLASALSWL